MTRERLAREVWGYEFLPSSRTIDVHIRAVRKKLGDRSDVVETVRGVGYRFRDPKAE